MTIEQKKKFGVYVLICPIKKEPIYIGCSMNVVNRYYTHLSATESNKLCQYVKNVLYRTLKRKILTIDVVFWTNDIKEARSKELELITEYNEKYTLLNTQLNNGYKLKKSHRFNPITN